MFGKFLGISLVKINNVKVPTQIMPVMRGSRQNWPFSLICILDGTKVFPEDRTKHFVIKRGDWFPTGIANDIVLGSHTS